MKQCLFILCFLLLYTSAVFAQGISEQKLEDICNRAMNAFNVPGLGIAIVKDGKVVYCGGFGIRSIKNRKKADENTLFGIASNSKAFTAAAIGILIDEGKLKLDDRLIDYLPEFRMYDPCITNEFTIREMLTHRSGLGLGAGDLLHNPDSNDFSIKDIIAGLRYLKPEASFRSRYAYDNIFYLVAGDLITRISGMSWGDFIEKRIMRPLKMNNSGASYKRVKNNPDIINGQSEVNGKLDTVEETDSEMDAGAGGIYSSAADMSKWMLLQLNDGKYGPDLGQQLFSVAVHNEMWTPQVVIPVTKSGDYHTHFGAYGLGWFLTDAMGYKEVEHTGQDDGMISEVEMIPELKLGITVLSNQEGGGAVRAIVDQLKDYYFGINGKDRVKEWADKVKVSSHSGNLVSDSVWAVVKQRENETKDTGSYRNYMGTYHDNWFGNIEIYKYNGALWFRSVRSPQLRGPLHEYKSNTFVVRWLNPKIQADAFVIFNMNTDGKAAGIKMERASPNISFAYDFQDLDFQRVEK